MIQFSANLSFLYQELPLSQRFAAAAVAGFRAVEFMFPQEVKLDKVKTELTAAKVKLIMFNLRAGNWAGGERGIACLDGREKDFHNSVEEAVTYAEALGTTRINCLAGKYKGDRSRAEDILIERLAWAADLFAKNNLTLLFENINTKDMPGYLIPTTQDAFRIQDRVQRANLKLQFDTYHAQRMEGDLINTLRNHIDRIGHIQIADNPGRGQPGTGEINYRAVLDAIQKSNYQGWIGLEYIPQPNTSESFGWMDKYCCPSPTFL